MNIRYPIKGRFGNLPLGWLQSRISSVARCTFLSIFLVGAGGQVRGQGKDARFFSHSSLIWFRFLHLNFSEASTFTTNGDQRIGRKYKKVVYRQYTDASFNKPMERTAAEKHLGVLGPMLHAEVWDTIEVLFKNMAKKSLKFSMHPHGLHYRYEKKTLPSLNLTILLLHGF